jgi:hypothetical protein
MPTYRKSDLAFSKYNNHPGTGGSGAHAEVPPNAYDFYDDDEKYVPNVVGAHGAVSSEWNFKYNPTRDEYLRDKAEAEAAGVPLGAYVEARAPKPKTLRLLVASAAHIDAEYGGPFWVSVSSAMRVVEFKKVIYEHTGVMPGLIRLAYAGKKLDDENRKLEHYGVRYWNAKFPDWPIMMIN